MKGNRKQRGPLATLLAACMLMTLLPVSALAEEGGEAVTVAAFEALDGAVEEQTVPYGTAREDLDLPGTLRAAVYTTAPDTEPVEIGGVAWEPDVPYEGAAGSYAFTASAAGYTPAQGVDWPVIIVTVEEAAAAPDEMDALCAAIDALPTVDEIYENAPGDADPEFDGWVTETKAKLAEVSALWEQFLPLSEDEAAMERITEARAEKLAALHNLAEWLGEMEPMADTPTPMADTPTPTVDGTNIFANGAEIKIVAGTTDGYTTILYDKDGDGTIGDTEYLKIGNTDPTDAGYNLAAYQIYGGGNDTDVDGATKITMTGGKINSLYGGGRAESNNADVKGAEIILSGGLVNNYVYGGGGARSSKSASVTGDTSVTLCGDVTVNNYVCGGGDVTGSGSTATVTGNAAVIMNGGTVGSNTDANGQGVHGGGKGNLGGISTVGSASVEMTGGTAVAVYGGGWVGNNSQDNVTGAVSVSLSESAVVSGGVYGGGYTANSGTSMAGSKTVTVGGGVKIGGDTAKGIVINGGTASVSNGVDSFVIANDLTESTSVNVQLPAGYNITSNPTIATGAVEADLAKIKLVGAGAEGKEAYFENNEIKVRATSTASTDATLTALTYKVGTDGQATAVPSFAADTQTYNVTLPYGTSGTAAITLSGTPAAGASITTNAGVTLSGGSGTATIIVTAEDGTTTKTYTVNFTTAAPSVTEYDVWVGGTRVTSENASDVLKDGKVSYDATTKTLTLNGASIAGTHTEAGIFAEKAALAAIALTGENVIGDAGNAELNCGIMNYNNPPSTNSPLSITGTGKLTVYLKRARNLGVSGVSADAGLTLDGVSLEIINKDGKNAISTLPRTYNGLGADNGLTVKNGAKVTLTDLWEGIIAASGTVAISEGSTVSITTAGPAINGGTVSIGSATVNVESSEQNENAIVANRIAISDDAHVTAKSIYPALYAISGINITGGTVEAISTNDCGIFTPANLAISGNGTQVTANGYFAGLQGNSGINITGGTVNATSTNDCGIFTPANLAISGERTQVTANGYYAGLRGNTGITISGGTVDAVSTNDIGMFCMGAIAITGGSVHAKGGTGWAAVAARAVKSGEAQPPLTIALTGMGEENGCFPMASGWFDISLDGRGTETRSWTSFVPANAGELTVTSGAMTNAVNEVRLAPPAVTGVTVTPATASIQKGNTQQFNATVTGAYLPARTVSWSLEDSHASGTGISDTGLLTVASEETATTLTVKATSTVDTNKSATATVTISDKTPLAEDQMTLTIDGWTYGETANTPTGSVTVTGDNGVISYQYSADNGTNWADTLPLSTAGFAKAGDYLVKMSYEGDAYIGSKTASFTVAQKAVTLGAGTLAATKPYDGTTTATLTGAPAMTGLLDVDAVTATGGSGVYAKADAGTGIAVAVTGFTLTGDDAGNYTTTGAVSGLIGSITPADGTTYSGYAAALEALKAVHIVTNVTPTLEGVTLPNNWAFTGDKTARLTASNHNSGKQPFPVQYTPASTNYAPVTLTDFAFPVSTVTLEVNGGLDMRTIESIDGTLILSPVALNVTGAALPDTGPYAISNMEWNSSVERIATVTGSVAASGMSATITAVNKGVTMVGVGYQHGGGMLGYVLVQVVGDRTDSANTVEDITSITETLDKLIDPQNPSATDKAAVDAVADEVTKLPDTAKRALTVEDVKALDELKQAVGENIQTGDKLNITIDKNAEGQAPAPDNVQVVGAAIACGVDSGEVVVTVKPVPPTGADTKLELNMEMTVDGAETQLAAPMFFQMDVPEGIDLENLKLYHVKNNGSKTELSYEKGAGRTISFKMMSFSSVQFVVSTGSTTGGNGGGGGGTTTYNLTATAGEGGRIAPSGNLRVSRNSDKTFTINPDEGYEIADVLVDGKSVGAVKTYTFEEVKANHTIAASFRAEDERPAWNPFTDVKEAAWYYDSVKYVYERGLMNGTGITSFSPNLSTTRGMIITILWRLEQEPESGVAMAFGDVKAVGYCYEAVRWGWEHEIVKGYTPTTFGPDNTITRQELVAILYRYAQYKGADVSAVGDLTAFTDHPEPWAEDAVKWALGAGILAGKGSGVLDPHGQATRAEAAAMLQRFAQRNPM